MEEEEHKTRVTLTRNSGQPPAPAREKGRGAARRGKARRGEAGRGEQGRARPRRRAARAGEE